MTLFAEKGFHAATVDEIARAAEVSPRTVTLYYPTKLDIAVASLGRSVERLAELIKHNTPDKPVVDVLADWLTAEVANVDSEERRLRSAMYAANPFLIFSAPDESEQISEVVSGAFERELGRAAESDAIRFLMGAVAGGLLQFEITAGTAEQPAVAIALFKTLMEGLVEAAKTSS